MRKHPQTHNIITTPPTVSKAMRVLSSRKSLVRPATQHAIQATPHDDKTTCKIPARPCSSNFLITAGSLAVCSPTFKQPTMIASQHKNELQGLDLSAFRSQAAHNFRDAFRADKQQQHDTQQPQAQAP